VIVPVPYPGMVTAPQAAPTVRVRFAPAPTGYLHIGGARTALFNWLVARHAGGEMVLRIEDTDVERSRPELIEAILGPLRWLGIDWDGEPVYQSTRTARYLQGAEQLLASGAAYRCDCTPDAVKARHDASGRKTPGYDGFCRDRDVGPGPGVVVRFRVPDTGSTAFDDLIRGRVAFDNATIEDFVIVRSDGSPMFLLANAVDDPDLGITHIIRGEDLINTTPKVILLRDALVPLLVGEDRKKLSKRREDESVNEYEQRGYLPEAVVNYLATLGWGAPDGVEIRPLDEIVGLFEIADVSSSGAFFDLKKLDHFDGEYVRALPTSEFVERAQPWLTGAVGELPWNPDDYDPDAFDAMAPMVQERVVRLDQVPGYVDFLFLPEPVVDQAAWDKVMVKSGDSARLVLDAVADAYETCDWTAGTVMAVIQAEGERLELPKKQWQAPVRVAVTGRSVGPPLGESLVVLGRERTLERLRAARRRL
jgi:glutamyl-tRNA synthetase